MQEVTMKMPVLEESAGIDLGAVHDEQTARADSLTLPKRTLLLTDVTQIEEEPIEWLWADRIPFGKLVLLAGDPDAGKSFLSIAIAAAVSKGKILPGNPGPIEPISTLMLEMEDGFADTVRPRADKCGVGPDAILVSRSVTTRE